MFTYSAYGSSVQNQNCTVTFRQEKTDRFAARDRKLSKQLDGNRHALH